MNRLKITLWSVLVGIPLIIAVGTLIWTRDAGLYTAGVNVLAYWTVLVVGSALALGTYMLFSGLFGKPRYRSRSSQRGDSKAHNRPRWAPDQYRDRDG